MGLLEDLDILRRSGIVEYSPFNYSAQWSGTIVASTGGVAQVISIQADAHFVVRYIACMTYVSATSLPVTPNTGLAGLTVAFQDQGSGRLMQDNPQSIQNLCGGVAAGGGNGSMPMVLPEPWLLNPKASVQITVANRTVITYPYVEISLIGFKVFEFEQGGLSRGIRQLRENERMKNGLS